MKIEKCPECHSSAAAIESDVQLVARCPDCFHLFYLHGDQELNEQTFLHFELLERIGQGSNAIVYKARNIISGELRALKMFLCCEQVFCVSDPDQSNVTFVHSINRQMRWSPVYRQEVREWESEWHCMQCHSWRSHI